jgi:hypothetical protein
MASPNIVGVTTIIGITTVGTLTTSFTSLVSNSSSSNSVLKINTIMIANIDGINNADVNIGYNSQAVGAGSTTYLAKTITVPADSSLVVLGKDAPIYLEEDRSIVGSASAENDLNFIISYETIM